MPTQWFDLDEVHAAVLAGRLNNPSLVVGVAGRVRGPGRRLDDAAARRRALAGAPPAAQVAVAATQPPRVVAFG